MLNTEIGHRRSSVRRRLKLGVMRLAVASVPITNYCLVPIYILSSLSILYRELEGRASPHFATAVQAVPSVLARLCILLCDLGISLRRRW